MDTVVRTVCVFSATLDYKLIRKIRYSEGQAKAQSRIGSRIISAIITRGP
jgi:hypothetical protein